MSVLPLLMCLFAVSCGGGAPQPAARPWLVDACAMDLREDIAVARQRLQAYLTGDGRLSDPVTWVAGPSVSGPWPAHAGPGHLRASLVRLVALRPNAAAHRALIAEAQSIMQDAHAITDALDLVHTLPSSCCALATLESHPLRQNVYVATILTRLAASRRRAAHDSLATCMVPPSAVGRSSGGGAVRFPRDR